MGSRKILKLDIGYDDWGDGISLGILDSKSNRQVALVFGETVEECEELGNDLIFAYNTLED